METIIGVLCIFGWSAALMFTLSRLRKTGKWDIQSGVSNTPNRIKIILRNQIMSFFFVLSVAFLFDKYVLIHGAYSFSAVLVHTFCILLVYDLFYYIMHRSLHHPTLMKKIHGVHHKSRKVAAPESLYLHPIENLAGLVLLFVVVFVMGANVTTFLVVFASYVTVMILNHSGMVFPHPIFKSLNNMAIEHDRHHSTDLNKNYASIFTFIYDRMFDTYK